MAHLLDVAAVRGQQRGAHRLCRVGRSCLGSVRANRAGLPGDDVAVQFIADHKQRVCGSPRYVFLCQIHHAGHLQRQQGVRGEA
jgi:hypothetical protein